MDQLCRSSLLVSRITYYVKSSNYIFLIYISRAMYLPMFRLTYINVHMTCFLWFLIGISEITSQFNLNLFSKIDYFIFFSSINSNSTFSVAQTNKLGIIFDSFNHTSQQIYQQILFIFKTYQNPTLLNISTTARASTFSPVHFKHSSYGDPFQSPSNYNSQIAFYFSQIEMNIFTKGFHILWLPSQVSNFISFFLCSLWPRRMSLLSISLTWHTLQLQYFILAIPEPGTVFSLIFT